MRFGESLTMVTITPGLFSLRVKNDAMKRMTIVKGMAAIVR